MSNGQIQNQPELNREPGRIALIGIMVENYDSAGEVNKILHSYGEYVIGRMGIPYRERKLSIISVILDAPESVTAAVAGKLGRLDGVSVKTLYSKIS